MAAPIIGVTTSSERTDKGVDRAFVNAAYIRAVERAGGVPLLLTPVHSAAALARFADHGDGLKPVAWADDKLIEAVELPGARGFVLAVQWHPEELVDDDPAARHLFEALVGAACQRRA